jgi:hypothetical protein
VNGVAVVSAAVTLKGAGGDTLENTGGEAGFVLVLGALAAGLGLAGAGLLLARRRATA